MSSPVSTSSLPKSKPDLVASVSKMTDAEATEMLRRGLGFDRFMRVMPEEWRPKLEAKAGGQMIRRVKNQNPNLRLKNLKPQHLRVVYDAESPTPH